MLVALVGGFNPFHKSDGHSESYQSFGFLTPSLHEYDEGFLVVVGCPIFVFTRKKYCYRFVSDSILCDAKSLSRTLHQSNSSGDMAANKPMLRLKQQTSLPLRSHGIVSDVPATASWYLFMFALWSAKRSPPVKKRLRARSQFLEHAVKHWHLPLTGFSTTHVAT